MPFSMKSTDHHAPAHSFETGIRETVAWYLENQGRLNIVRENHLSADGADDAD